MYRLFFEQPAVEDIRAMVSRGGEAKRDAQRIMALLQEIKGSQSELRDLTTDHFYTDDYEVGKYLEFWNAGADLWKMKIFEFNDRRNAWDLIPYRVLYAYDVRDSTFRVLGILPRSFNYDKDHELTKRILASYSELGLPKHRVYAGNGRNRSKPH